MKNEKFVVVILYAAFYLGFSLQIHAQPSDVSVKDGAPYVLKPPISGSNGKYFEEADCKDCSMKNTPINQGITATTSEIGRAKLTHAMGNTENIAVIGKTDIPEGTTETLSPVRKKVGYKIFDSSEKEITHRMHQAQKVGALGKYFLSANFSTSKSERDMVVKGKIDGGSSTGKIEETRASVNTGGTTGTTRPTSEGTMETEISEKTGVTTGTAQGTIQTTPTEKTKVHSRSHQLKKRDTQYLKEPPVPGSIGKYFVYVDCKSCNVKNKLVTVEKTEKTETSSTKEETGVTGDSEETEETEETEESPSEETESVYLKAEEEGEGTTKKGKKGKKGTAGSTSGTTEGASGTKTSGGKGGTNVTSPKTTKEAGTKATSAKTTTKGGKKATSSKTTKKGGKKTTLPKTTKKGGKKETSGKSTVTGGTTANSPKTTKKEGKKVTSPKTTTKA